jgi:hypothetical protein
MRVDFYEMNTLVGRATKIKNKAIAIAAPAVFGNSDGLTSKPNPYENLRIFYPVDLQLRKNQYNSYLRRVQGSGPL